MKPPSHRYLVTGLCMQGNKGGPALALALTDAIRQEIPDAQFVFAVRAAGEEWDRELAWARRYGFALCRTASPSCLIPPSCLRADRRQRWAEWWAVLRSCDALIQMSAICYVGPPAGTGSWRAMLRSPRVFDFASAQLARLPMRAWTQSYGPLTTTPVRFFAKRDLSRQPIVFCRGSDCAAAVRQLLPRAKALDFPDVAVTLRFDQAWGANYVGRTVPLRGPFATLSPSAVLFARAATPGTANRHVQQCRAACSHLLDRGYSVLLVPHTLRPAQPEPSRCDLAVAELVCAATADPRVAVLREDLSPVELKGVIANAVFHIGARYHSVVAALSAAVPALALSWHPKYRDLLRPYGMEDFLLGEDAPQDLDRLIDQLCAEAADLRPILAERQGLMVEKVRENARLFCTLLPGQGGGTRP